MNSEQLQAVKAWLGSGSINLFGLPFAGKDTHGIVLAEMFNAPLLGGGDILRGSVIPPNVKEAMEKGALIPTDDYIRIVLPYLSRKEFAGRPLVLSSVGRWVGEEEGVLSATEASGHPTKAVIYLHVDPDTVRERWAVSKRLGDRGDRPDDAAQAFELRLEEFATKTLPVIEAYRQNNLLIEVNSEASKEDVLESILARLYLRATS